MSFQFEENRKEPRISIKFAATLHWRGANGLEMMDKTFTENISNSGAAFTTRHQLNAGVKINVNLDIEGQYGSSSGVVRWSELAEDGFRIGVSFER